MAGWVGAGERSVDSPREIYRGRTGVGDPSRRGEHAAFRGRATGRERNAEGPAHAQRRRAPDDEVTDRGHEIVGGRTRDEPQPGREGTLIDQPHPTRAPCNRRRYWVSSRRRFDRRSAGNHHPARYALAPKPHPLPLASEPNVFTEAPDAVRTVDDGSPVCAA